MVYEIFGQQIGKVMSIKKGEHVFFQGVKNDSMYYVESGLLKAYYLSKDGKENIKSFIQKGNIIGSIRAVYFGDETAFNLVALEDCNLTQFPFEKLLDAATESHSVATELIHVLLTHSMKKEQREYEFLMLSAEERYARFQERFPDLTDKLTQNDIARYLGINPVSLSRIKRASA